MSDLRQLLTRSVAEECEMPQAVRFNPDAMAYEAFRMGITTYLLDPLSATSHSEALAEATARWAWDRGDRLAIREIGNGKDRLFVYAVRKKANGIRRDFTSVLEHQRWLEHITTIDLSIVTGSSVGLAGSERELHRRRQAERPAGAVL